MTKETDKLVLPDTAHRYSLRPAFALNRALREVRILAQTELENLGITHIVPYLFNKRTRTFLTYGFADDALTTYGKGRTAEIFNRIQEDLVGNTMNDPAFSVNRWALYLAHVNTSNQDHQKKIEVCLKLESVAQWIHSLLDAPNQAGQEEIEITPEDKVKFIDFLRLFSYEQWMDIYIHHEQHRNMHLNGLFFKLLHDDEIDQFDALAFSIKNHDNEDNVGHITHVHSLRSSQQDWVCLGEKEQELGTERIHFKLTTLFALPDEIIPPWVLLIPIYDNYIAGKAYGGICATLQIPYFKNILEPGEGDLVSIAVRKLISFAPIISLEIAASGVERAIRDKVASRHTTISEFVSGLRYLQDWQCIKATFSNPCEDSIFSRDSRARASDSDWADSKLIESSNGKCMESDRGTPVILSWSRVAKKGAGAVANDVNLAYIEGMEKNLSELSGLERIEFFFPKYFRLPVRKIKDDDSAEIDSPCWQAYCDDLIRQQRELLSVLMPKLRARKAALRSAVSAIMGRNMSHNIGSHVLARYSNEVKKDNQKTDQKLKDPREDFLRYLQRRMDFIAEVATADQSFWSQALSIEGVLDTLNLDKEKAAINGINGGGRKPILLSYITGKEFEEGPLTATVEIDPATNGDHRLFACPSGEVGVHALYVILENIIRNSARHNESTACPITVRVKIEEEEKYPDLWKLTLTDLQTQTSETKCVHGEINKNLDTKILDKDGAPNPKYWGIREMQVCAQYLRNLPLSDLEGPQSFPPILKAVNNEDRLAYVLYVPRAKLCVLASKSPLVVDVQKKFLRAKGFDFVLSEGKTDAELADALRGYAYAVIEEGVQGVPQALTIAKPPNSNIVSENWVKKIDWPVRTLCMSKGRLEELISSLSDQTENIQGQGTVSDGAAYDPMKWLEDELHNRLMTEYQNRRGYLAGKEVAVKVGWEDPCDEKNCKFEHTTTENLSKWTFDSGPFLCWIDHAKAEHFTSELPCLLAACRVTTNTPIDDAITISAWVYAEVINSHSAHRHDLVSQRDGKISGNELMAAALAKVVIIDERVQSVACEKYREIEYSTLWPCMGIWVPSTKEANLNFPVFREICTFLEMPAELSGNLPIDFVVLHLTILEKLAQELRSDEQSALSQLISCAKLSPSCEVVIVTGRGVPAVARHEASKRLNARYLPISALLEYLVSNPSKLAVMRALWSAATSKTTE